MKVFDIVTPASPVQLAPLSGSLSPLSLGAKRTGELLIVARQLQLVEQPFWPAALGEPVFAWYAASLHSAWIVHRVFPSGTSCG